MKVVILYRPDSEHARAVDTFSHDFQNRYQESRLEIINVDSREGIAMASLYDIMRFPAILAMSGDGGLQKYWEGDALPLIDEVASYVQAV